MDIGQIVKAQGIKGELKVKPLTDDAQRFLSLKEVFIDNTSFVVKGVSVRGGAVFLCLDGIADRTAAEDYRGKMITVPREAAVKLQEGQYFVVEMLGCECFVDSKSIGTVTAIDNFGSADVYTVTGEKGIVRFPFLKKLIVNVDSATRRIELDGNVFAEVSVYEN